MMENVRYITDEFCWNEKQIRGATPEILFNLVHSVKESLKKQIGTSRLVTDAETYTDDMRNMQAEFGKWSHDFNIILRQMIKENELFESSMMMYKTKRLNLVYLYWWKCANYLEILYLPLLQIPARKLAQSVKAMDQVNDHFLTMEYNEPVVPTMMGGANDLPKAD